MSAATADARRCWICGSTALALRKASDVTEMRSHDFAISDAHYGRTAAVYQCAACGFLECPDVGAVLPYYEALEDSDYEASRAQRRLQARGLLNRVARMLNRDLAGLRLLDIGAGSGPLVEEAVSRGMHAEGIEPSVWLASRAAQRGLAIHRGVLPHPAVVGPFDVVTLIDVIEHTREPVELLQQASAAASPGGVVVIVTPDVRSLPARMMGWRWWHFRLAHVGYFSAQTLSALCDRAELAPMASARPGWVLPLSYLAERANRYLPRWLHLPQAAWMASIAVPFNLRDSIMLCARTRS